MTADLFNEVANHPDVRPWIGHGLDPVDLSQAASDPRNVFLWGVDGGWWLHPLGDGVYEIHSLFLKSGRGKTFFEGAREVLRYMFVQTDATEILTKCPDDNRGAIMAAKIVGFRERFRRENAWAPGVGISYWAFTLDDWMARDPQVLAEGRAFHDWLEQAKIDAGSSSEIHDDDEAHDRAAGAAKMLISAGQTQRGVALYNRWAIFAGYATIEAIGPGLVDIRDAIIQVKDGSMDAILIR
jgi:hypothetical protein